MDILVKFLFTDRGHLYSRVQMVGSGSLFFYGLRLRLRLDKMAPIVVDVGSGKEYLVHLDRIN